MCLRTDVVTAEAVAAGQLIDVGAEDQVADLAAGVKLLQAGPRSRVPQPICKSGARRAFSPDADSQHFTTGEVAAGDPSYLPSNKVH